MLIATSDYEEVVQVADRAAVMARGRHRRELEGDDDHDKSTSHRGGWLERWASSRLQHLPRSTRASPRGSRRVDPRARPRVGGADRRPDRR